MNETLIVWASGLAVAAAVSAFARFVPKQKIIDKITPACRAAGVVVSKFLILRIGAHAAERVEEGVIVTLVSCVGESCSAFVDGLLSDNSKKKEGKA